MRLKICYPTKSPLMPAKPRSSKAVSSPPHNALPASIPDQVKTAILLTYGMPNPDPGALDANKPMSGFNFNDFQWMKLAARLTKIVGHGNTVSVPELENMSTVQDCIDLVTQKSTK